MIDRVSVAVFPTLAVVQVYKCTTAATSTASIEGFCESVCERVGENRANITYT